MLQLYGLDHNKLHALTNYKDLKRESTLDGEEILSFSYSQYDIKYDSIKEETYIRTKDNEYVIKEVNKDDAWSEIVAKVNVESIKGKNIDSFETVEETCTNSINLALTGTGWTIGNCDVVKKRTVRKARCSAYDVIQEIRNVYRCEFKFDAINKKIYVYQKMGDDKGVYFSEELNLKKLTIRGSSYDYCTRIISIGKDGLNIKDINGGKEYVENYQYSTKIITVYWEDNRYTNAKSLMEDAILKLDELSVPTRAYSADIVDLAKLSDKYNLLSYGLGDVITLLSKDKRVKEKQRIVKLIEYLDEPEKNSCEIANRVNKLDDIEVDNQETIDAASDVLTSYGGIDGSKVDSIDATTQIRNLDSEVARITNLSVINANIDNLYANKASIDSLSAATARIGTLEATTVTTAQLSAVQGNINVLTANKADVNDLSASNGRISTLESKAASIDNLLAGNISAKNLQTGLITADSGLIAKEAINDALIANLSVSKILAGDISTTKFRIVSDSGKMLISDNTIQIKDASRVRVQIGKDASNDYNMYVWDSSGNLMFDATGLKAGGIKSKIIRDDMVSDTANINGSKIEKESLVAQVNGATTTLKASKVKLDTENQTLDLAFTSLKSTVTNQGTTITNQGTAISTIQGQISTKIWQQDITTAVSNINSQYSTLNQTVSNISANVSSLQTTTSNLGTRMSSAESALSIQSGQIATKVTQTDINNSINSISLGGRNILLNSNNFKDTSNWVLEQWNPVNANFAYTNPGVRNDSWTGNEPCLEIHIAHLDSGEYGIQQTFNTVVGRQYTVSGYLAGHRSNKQILIRDSTGGWVTRQTVGAIYGAGNLNDWFRINFTFTATTTTSILKFDITSTIGDDGYIWLKYLKVEEGNKATAWSPNPSEIQTQIDSATTRINTAETNINQLSTSISLKVDTSTYNSYKATNDTNISSLQSRMSAAELKITDSSIISTLRTSTAYTSDLSSKANQSDLNTTNTNVTAAQNTANAKRRVFTSTPTTPYDIGDLWVTTNGAGDLMTCKTARSSGAYTASDWVKGVKYTDDTTANAVQGNLNTTNSNLSALTNRVGTAETSITQLNTSITLKVNTTDFNTLTGRVSSTESSISTLQGQITSKVDVNGVRSVIQQNPSDVQIGFNGINNNVTIDGTGFTVKNGAVKIKDSNSNDLFWVDSSGRLTARHLYIYGPEAGGNIDIRGNGNKGIALRSLDGGQRYFDFTTLDGGTSYAQNAASNTFTRLLANGANFYIMPSQELHIYGVNPAQPTLGVVDIDTNNFNVTNNIYAAKKISSGGNVEASGKVIGASIETPGAIYAKSDIKSEANVRIGSTLYTRSVCHMDGTSAYTIPFHSNIDMQNLNIFNCNLAANSISCTGTKNRIVTTEHFGTRALNAVESADCYFIDIGEGQVTEGKCIIPIDCIFKETVNVNISYQVFLTKYGKGELYVTERNPNYFIVEGDDISFGWEIKAKQKDYENTRLELRTA